MMERVNLHRLPSCDHRGNQYERNSLNTILQTLNYFLLPLVIPINVVGRLSGHVSVVVLILSFLNVGLVLGTMILRPWLLG